MKLQVDPDKLTLGEVLEIEERAGMGIQDVLRTMPTRGLAAIVMVIKRREQPSFSWDDVLELDFHAVDATFDAAATDGLGYRDGGAVDPTEPSGDGDGST
jgi:hypothetical protein